MLHRFEQLAKRRPSQFLAFLHTRPCVLYLLWLVGLWLEDERDDVTGVLVWRLIGLVGQQRWKRREGEAEDEEGGEADEVADDPPEEDDEDDDDDEEDDGEEEKEEPPSSVLVMMVTDKDGGGKDGKEEEKAAPACPFVPMFQAIAQHGGILSSFVQQHLLSSPDSSLRTHAQSFLYLMWTYSPPAIRSRLFTALSAWLSYLPLYGQQAQQAYHLLSSIVSSSHSLPALGPTSHDLRQSVSSLLRSLDAQVAVTAGHRQAEFFDRLGRVLGQQREVSTMTEDMKAQHALFETYCASSPCHVCHATPLLLPAPKEKEKKAGCGRDGVILCRPHRRSAAGARRPLRLRELVVGCLRRPPGLRCRRRRRPTCGSISWASCPVSPSTECSTGPSSCCRPSSSPPCTCASPTPPPPRPPCASCAWCTSTSTRTRPPTCPPCPSPSPSPTLR